MSVVAVGVFDGLHRGHMELFARARARAAGGRCIAVSFDPHPDVVLAREFRALAPLTPLPEKLERLAAIGVQLHVVPFTRELAALSPEDFVASHLVAPFAPRWLVVGEDFALGRGRAGDVSRLTRIGHDHGFEVESVALATLEGRAVTSTRIRAALAEGDVGLAARMLGRWFSITGTVVHGEKIGRTLGYPTANLRLHEERQLPALGIYAVWARISGDSLWRPGAMSIGVRPTFGGQVRTLEVHLLDWSGDLYDQVLDVRFAAHLRPELHFADVGALIVQMGEDVAETRRRLGSLDPERHEIR